MYILKLAIRFQISEAVSGFDFALLLLFGCVVFGPGGGARVGGGGPCTNVQ